MPHKCWDILPEICSLYHWREEYIETCQGKSKDKNNGRSALCKERESTNYCRNAGENEGIDRENVDICRSGSIEQNDDREAENTEEEVENNKRF